MTHQHPKLRRGHLHHDPLRQFEDWFAETSGAAEQYDAAALATASPAAVPSVRMVLVKRFEEAGLVFHTHSLSRKGRELEGNPRAALLFYWAPLGRQIRVEGRVGRIDDAEADEYFAGRPRDAQIGAHASRQSEPIPGRKALEKRVSEIEHAYEGRDVPRPAAWVGYRLVPRVWEFWQHGESRLHDRFRYTRHGEEWLVERLAP